MSDVGSGRAAWRPATRPARRSVLVRILTLIGLSAVFLSLAVVAALSVLTLMFA